MRARRWVLYLFAILFGLLVLSINGWRFFQANERVKKYILSEVRPVLGENCNISQVRLGFGNIRFLGVEIPLPDKQFSVVVKDIRIGFNLFSLLLKGFDPRNVSKDILIINPRLNIHVANVDTSKASYNILNYPSDISELRTTYKKQLNRLEFLKRLTIKEGEIYYYGYDSLKVLLANSIEGGFFVDRSDSIEIRMKGKLFSSENQNLNLSGKAWGETGTISYIKAELQNYNLKEHLPQYGLSFLEFIGGELNGELLLDRKSGPQGHFNLSGGITISNASAVAYDGKIELENMNIQSHVENWNLIIDQARQVVNGADVELTGNVVNVLNPYFDLTLSSNNIKVEKFSTTIGEQFENQITGLARIKTNVNGPLSDISINSYLNSRKLRYKNFIFKDIEIDNSFNKEKLSFDQCRFHFAGNEFILNATANLTEQDKSLAGSLIMQGDVGPNLNNFSARNIRSCPSWLNAKLSGSTESPVMRGDFGFQFISNSNDTTLVESDFFINGPVATLIPRNENNGPGIHGYVENIGSRLNLNISMDQIQDIVFSLWNIPYSDYLAQNLTMDLDLNGFLNDIKLSFNINKLEGGYFKSSFADITAIINRKNDKIKGNGQIYLYPNTDDELEGEFSFLQHNDSFRLEKFNFADHLSATFTSKKDTLDIKSLTGVLKARDFDITELFIDPDTLYRGNLDMDISLGGTFADPVLNGNVTVKDITYQNIGPYNTEIEFNWERAKLKLTKFALNSSDATLLYAYGQYFSKDSLDFMVKGAGFNLNTLWQSQGNEEPPVSGNTLVDLSITGSKQDPDVRGVIAIKSGAIHDIPFDEIEINLDNNPVSYPGIFIRDFRLTRHNEFELNGQGLYPINTQDSMYVDIEGKGNFLRILSDKFSYFQITQSEGSALAHIEGTPQNPVLQSAEMNFVNGQMQCRSIIPLITDITGDFEFIPENQFIYVKRLDGFMGGKPFSIRTTMATQDMSSKPVDNIILGESGLNLGVIIPETPEKGIPLNIEGLMEPGVYGNLDLIGRDGEENFYFASVGDRLTFRGGINLYNCEIMYPFYEGAKLTSETMKNFLKNLEWDVLVKPVNDVRYVRTFPAAIDNVYVNLQLDQEYSQLDFTGQIQDDSFRINGKVSSTKGVIDYLDMNFRVERAGAEFDRSSLVPVVYGNARTSVADSAGFPSQIMLTLQTHDVTMDKKSVDDLVREENSRGRWDQIRFKLSSDNPNVGSTESQILSTLGYTDASLQQNPALDAIGFGTENILFRPLIRPVERKLEETLGLDYVRFSSRFTKNFIDFNLNNNVRVNSRLALLRSTRLVVGKYIADRLFFQYTGQVESGIDYRYKDINVGLHHQMGLEYHINSRLLLELEYDYDSLIWNRQDRDDKRIVLRHWFPF